MSKRSSEPTMLTNKLSFQSKQKPMANINETRRKSMKVVTLGNNLNLNANPVNKNFKPS